MYIFGGILELTKEINEMMTYDFEGCAFDLIEGYSQEQLAKTTKVEEESPALKRRMTMANQGLSATAVKAK